MFGLIFALIILFLAHIKPVLTLSFAILIILKQIFDSAGESTQPLFKDFYTAISTNASMYANSASHRFRDFYDLVKSWPWQTIAVFSACGLWVLEGCFKVDTNEKAIILRLGSVNRYVEPGLRWHIPVFETYMRINVNQVSHITKTNRIVTNDEGIIDVTMTVFYKVDPDKVFNYKFKANSPESIVDSITDSIIREVIANKKVEECLTTGRTQIAKEVQEKLSTKLDNYDLGISIQSVQVGRIDPPVSVLKANRRVMDAQCEYSAKQNEAVAYYNKWYPEAEGEASRITADAKIRCQLIDTEAKKKVAYFNSLFNQWQVSPSVLKRMVLNSLIPEISEKVKLTYTPSTITSMVNAIMKQIITKETTKVKSDAK